MRRVQDVCEARGAQVTSLLVDVTDVQKFERMLLQVDARQPVDLLLVNAGVNGRLVLGTRAGDDLEEGAFPGPVFTDDAKGLAAVDVEGDVLEGPEVAVVGGAVKGKELLEAVRRGIVDGIALRNAVEFDDREWIWLVQWSGKRGAREGWN